MRNKVKITECGKEEVLKIKKAIDLLDEMKLAQEKLKDLGFDIRGIIL